MKKILLVGPILPPIHGQSLAFTRLCESIEPSRKTVVNTNIENTNSIKKLLFSFRTLARIAANTIFNRYDVVYFTCSRSFLGSVKDILLINLAKMKKTKVINHLHGSDFYDFFHHTPLWYQKVLRDSYEKVDISIVLLPKMKEQFKDFKKMKIEVVPNFYDKELGDTPVQKDTSQITMLYLSNIMKSKGIFELLEAFELLSKKYQNISLNIAGDFFDDEHMKRDEIKEKFEQKISQNHQIHYHGKVFGEGKSKLLQESDIFILPSYYRSEAFPISIIEAMSSANAIIATDYKYLPEVVGKENGILAAPKSVDDLISAIAYLLNHETELREIQRYNQLEAQHKYGLEQYIEKLHHIIEEEGL